MMHTQLKQVVANDSSVNDSPLLSVIVPIFNEQATLLQLLHKIIDETTEKEVILIDDGSSDQTAEIISEWIQDGIELTRQTHRIVWSQNEENLGKGASIRSGLSEASGKYVVVQDADLEVLPSDYPKLLEPLVSNNAQFVIGSRVFANLNKLSFHRLGVRLLNSIVKLIYGYNISDSACCFKVLKRSDLLAMDLQCMGFEYCPEVISKAARMQLKITEVDVEYFPRTASDGKKLRLIQDGFQAVQTLLKYRNWNPNAVSQTIGKNIHETT